MADQEDYLSPPNPQQPPQQGINVGGLVDQWRGWLQNPQNQAFLMQTGLALMQPRGAGANFFSHAASALGEGGEAAQRVSEHQQTQQELQSRQTERVAKTRQTDEGLNIERDLLPARKAALYGSASRAGGAGVKDPDEGIRREYERLINQVKTDDLLGTTSAPDRLKAIAKTLGIDVKQLLEDPDAQEQGYQIYRKGRATLQDRMDVQRTQREGRAQPAAAQPNVVSDDELRQRGQLDDPETVRARNALARAATPQARQEIIRLYLMRKPGASIADLQ